MKTAVEWLVDELSQWEIKYTETKGKISKEVYETTKNYFQEQAKEKEREQIEGFAEWLIYQDICQRGKGNFVCWNGVQRTTTELLEIYKQGL